MKVGEFTHIRSDKDTLAKLKVMAGDKPVATFLRDLANGVEQTPVPVNELEALRKSVLKRLEKLENSIHQDIVRLYNEIQNSRRTNDAFMNAFDILDQKFPKLNIADTIYETQRQARLGDQLEPIEVDAADELAYFENDESESDEQ